MKLSGGFCGKKNVSQIDHLIVLRIVGTRDSQKDCEIRNII